MSSGIEKNNLTNSSSNFLTTAVKAEKNIYCISGLGADRRVFNKLIFKGYRPIHLDWLTPHNRENLTDYARRLAAEIHDENPIILGLSFGGMVAVEIAQQINVDKVILVSTIKSKRENPWYFKLFRWFPLHLIVPFKTLLWAVYWLLDWFFSLETQAERKLLRAILKDTDPKFLKWAINRVVSWQNETAIDNSYHIHGTSDRIFPITFVNPDITIEKAGHFMIMNQAERISQLIEEIINN